MALQYEQCIEPPRFHPGRPVEAVISPSTPYAGVLPGKFKYSRKLILVPGVRPCGLAEMLIGSFYTEYTSSLNVLDFPNVVIPVTFADKTIDQVKADYKPLTETDRLNMALCMEQSDVFWEPGRMLTNIQMILKPMTAPQSRCKYSAITGTKSDCCQWHNLLSMPWRNMPPSTADTEACPATPAWKRIQVVSVCVSISSGFPYRRSQTPTSRGGCVVLRGYYPPSRGRIPRRVKICRG